MATSALFLAVEQAQVTTPDQPSPSARTQPAKAYRAEQWADLDDLVGPEVRLEASISEEREAAKEGERAEGGDGELSDVVLDIADGAAKRGVVSCGGFLGIDEKHVLVPTDSLRWNGVEACFFLGLTEEQLKGMPEFDLDDAREEGFDSSLSAHEAAWKKQDSRGGPVEADAWKPQQTAGKVRSYGETRFAPNPSPYVAASELDGVDVSLGARPARVLVRWEAWSSRRSQAFSSEARYSFRRL